ncbi:IQ domain-containing protein E [Amia ocellicauda]|uniref:IQ domain-containing protein E n=1 Tax=Amia ocellicauda TaxID=2972642 RepID=UPI003464A010
MSVAASDCLTDEELEDLGEDGLSVATYMSESGKRPRKKKTSGKPPQSPKSPYLSSTNPKKAAVWRSLKGAGTMHIENPATRVPREFWLASLKSGAGLSQPLKADYDALPARVSSCSSTPEYLKEALGMKKPKHARSSSNGYVPGTPDFKEKEDMYDEIMELKKALRAQKSESDLMKTKLRRLEEENSKKEKRIEQLLDPAKGCEYTRSLVDRKHDASAIVNGLKQKVLKLEQQCKERDSALTKLQNDLKTTNIEEMKIAMETYYEEVQRLRILLANAESAEKKAESREVLKQQKVLHSTILRLSKNIKQLQEENTSLKADLDRATEIPSVPSSARGYAEWSKQRLLRRIAELEKKQPEPETGSPQLPDGGARATHVSAVASGSDPLTLGVMASPKTSDPRQECERLRGLVRKLREERADLQHQLADNIALVKQLAGEKAEITKDAERARTLEREAVRREFREEIQSLTETITRLEKELEDRRHVGGDSVPSGGPVKSEKRGPVSRDRGSGAHGVQEQKPQSRARREEEAAKTIQKHWRQHRHKNENQGEDSDEAAVVIQAALRGHLSRKAQLENLTGPPNNTLRSPPDKAPQGKRRSDVLGAGDDGGGDAQDVTLLQSAFRGHLARSGRHGHSLATEGGTPSAATRGEPPAPTAAPRRRAPAAADRKSTARDLKATVCSDEEVEEDLPAMTGREDDEERTSKEAKRRSDPSSRQRKPPALSSAATPNQTRPAAARAADSDDSDDIVVSPSWPPRHRDSFF